MSGGASALWLNLPLRIKGLIVLVIPIAAIVASSFVFYASQRREDRAQRALAHSVQVRETLRDVLTLLTEGETGTRGYLLTSEPEWLEPYDAAIRDLPRALAQLQELVQDDDVQRARAATLVRLADRRLQTMVDLQSFSVGSTERPLPVPPELLTQGKRAMDAVRQQIDQMEAVEEALIVERRSNVVSAQRWSMAVVISGGILGVGGGLLAVLFFTTGVAGRVRRLEQNAERLATGEVLEALPEGIDEIGQLARRLVAASQLLRQREAALQQASREIEDLYDKAPCGYHSLDANGVFVSINETELAWLGYSRDEIVGRRRFSELITTAGVEVFRAEFPEFKRRGWVNNLEFDMVRKDGSILPVLLSATAIVDEAGRYVSSRSTVFDNTERHAAERRIQELNQELQRRLDEVATVNRELEAFSYSVSHDLRAPLRHVQGFATLLKEHAASRLDEKGLRFLGTIDRAATQMGSLIDDLLAFSRMGRAEMMRSQVDLNAIAGDVRAELDAAANGRRIAWTLHPLPTIQADPSMLRLVLTNLMANAVKYSSRREVAVVELGHSRTPDEVVVYVRDNGAGFDMRYADKLFRVFQRLHRADEFEGTGIGLASVRRIVSRHGGRTWAEGVPDQGATFYFSLPA